jgi:hypothetical protein
MQLRNGKQFRRTGKSSLDWRRDDPDEENA